MERKQVNMPKGTSEGRKQLGGMGLQEHWEFSKGKCTALNLARKRL